MCRISCLSLSPSFFLQSLDLFDGYPTMDPITAICYNTTPYRYPPILPNTTKPIGTGVTQCPGPIVPNNQPPLNRPPPNQPLLNKYHYILGNTKKRNERKSIHSPTFRGPLRGDVTRDSQSLSS